MICLDQIVFEIFLFRFDPPNNLGHYICLHPYKLPILSRQILLEISYFVADYTLQKYQPVQRGLRPLLQQGLSLRPKAHLHRHRF